MAKLLFTGPVHGGRIYELSLEKTTVGRGDQNTLVIADSSLSSVHCEILMHGPEIIIRDLGSRNGTVVNGTKLVNQQAQLKSGQTVQFGAVEARLDLGEPPEDGTSTEMTAIYSLDRFMRDQEREKKRPKVNPSMKLESPGGSEPENDTVTTFLQRPPGASTSPAEAPGASPFEKPTGPAARTKAILLVAVLFLILIVLAWLLWGPKA